VQPPLVELLSEQAFGLQDDALQAVLVAWRRRLRAQRGQLPTKSLQTTGLAVVRPSEPSALEEM